MSKWTDFVKEWATKNNMSYGCALSQPECSAEYKKKNPKPLTKKQQAKQEAKEKEGMGGEDKNVATKKTNDIKVRRFVMFYDKNMRMDYIVYVNTDYPSDNKPVYKFGTNEDGKQVILLIGKLKPNVDTRLHRQYATDKIEDIRKKDKEMPENTRLVNIDTGKVFKNENDEAGGRGEGLEPMGIKEGEENIQMVIAEKKRRGRPPKYETEEERKKAKSLKTVESNKRKKTEKGKMSGGAVPPNDDKNNKKRRLPEAPIEELAERERQRQRRATLQAEATRFRNMLKEIALKLEQTAITFINRDRTNEEEVENAQYYLNESYRDFQHFSEELTSYVNKINEEEKERFGFNVIINRLERYERMIYTALEDITADIRNIHNSRREESKEEGKQAESKEPEEGARGQGLKKKMSGEGGGMSKEQIEIARREEARRNGTADAVTRLVTENMAGLENTEWTARFAELSKEDKLRYRRLLKQAQDKRQKEEDLEERMKKGKGKGKGINKTVLKKEKAIENELIGKGILSAGYKAEHTNGLGHIYPISHDLILQMLKQYD